MMSPPPLKILETHRLDLRGRLEELKNFNVVAREVENDFTRVCYDNRYHDSYYVNQRRYVEKLAQQTERCREDCELIINHALAAQYQSFFYGYFDGGIINNRVGARATKDPGTRPWVCLAYAARSFKYERNPAAAAAYLAQAQTANKAAGITSDNRLILRIQVYDFYAVLAEAREDFAGANYWLTQAITSAETARAEQWQRNIKYLHIRRALLAARENNPEAALADLAQALTYRREAELAGNILTMDEIIYWERVKLFIKIKNRPAARENLACLINITHINFSANHWWLRPSPTPTTQSKLLAILKEFQAHLRTQTPQNPQVTINNYHRRRPQPEPRKNYDSLHVNVKCPVYQKFIAKIYTKSRKTARDWEYLIAYEFGLHPDKRDYEYDVGPVKAQAARNQKFWWVPGVHYFYLDRDYPAAVRFFNRRRKAGASWLGYELAAKANSAAGNHARAITILTGAIKRLRAELRRARPTPDQLGQLKIYLLWRGVGYAQIKNYEAAASDYTQGLKIDAPGKVAKIGNMLHWARARLRLIQKDIPAALQDLEKIKDNPACKNYLQALRGKQL